MTVPQNATPSLTMAISYDSCMLTNLNEDAPEKGRRKKLFPRWLTLPTAGLGK